MPIPPHCPGLQPYIIWTLTLTIPTPIHTHIHTYTFQSTSNMVPAGAGRRNWREWIGLVEKGDDKKNFKSNLTLEFLNKQH